MKEPIPFCYGTYYTLHKVIVKVFTMFANFHLSKKQPVSFRQADNQNQGVNLERGKHILLHSDNCMRWKHSKCPSPVFSGIKVVQWLTKKDSTMIRVLYETNNQFEQSMGPGVGSQGRVAYLIYPWLLINNEFVLLILFSKPNFSGLD